MALERGAEAAISIGATAEDLLEVIRAAMAGDLEDSPAAQYAEESTHLGTEAGLSERETDVLRLIAQGISNQEIAETLFLSVNSVKTYIRSTYHKIGVASRAQAVAWAMQHGFPPDSPSTEGDLRLVD